MFLGAYHFTGDRDELLAAYERLHAAYPPETLDLHVCVANDDGITVYDACPSRDVFASFSSSAEFADALDGAGLPTPRVVQLGEVHAAMLREEIHA
jgi:hypothetical protein